jgi:hypothetical protein
VKQVFRREAGSASPDVQQTHPNKGTTVGLTTHKAAQKPQSLAVALVSRATPAAGRSVGS